MAASPLPKTGLRPRELLHRGVGAQVLVALEALEGGDEVVEEAPVVRRGEVLVRGDGELVLLLAADLPLDRGERRGLPHREPGAGLAVLRDRRREVLRADLGQRGQPALEGLGAVRLEQDLAELLVHRDRCVGRGVRAAGDAHLDLAEGDLVGHRDGRLDAGVAGLLEVVGRRLGRQPGAEHRLAGEVEVPGVLEHGAGHHLAEPLALQAVAGDQSVDRGGQHVLVGRGGVDRVRAREGDAVAADDGDATGLGLHGGAPRVDAWLQQVTAGYILARPGPGAHPPRRISRNPDTELQSRSTRAATQPTPEEPPR